MSHDFLAGWFGGAAGIAVSHPLDIVRVRLQLSTQKVQPGVLGELVTLVRREGVRSLVRGIASPLLTVGLWKAVIFATSERVLAVSENGEVISDL